jgi:hypothetical protein
VSAKRVGVHSGSLVWSRALPAAFHSPPSMSNAVEITAAFWNEDRYKNACFNLRKCGIKIGRGGVELC